NTTVSPTFGLSSAVTLCTSAHFSSLAPGGVRQETCQAPWVARTTLPGPVAAGAASEPASGAAPCAYLESQARAARRSQGRSWQSPTHSAQKLGGEAEGT